MEIITRNCKYRLSDIAPVEWAETHMKLNSGRFQGPLRYDISPFSREILDALSPYHPANEVVVMGAAKWGKTKTIIEPALAYWISEHPCEMLYLVGHSELSDYSMEKLDNALDNAGLSNLIGYQGLRAKNKRTGDTTKMKSFPGGSLIAGSASNHKILRQRDPLFVIADDIDVAADGSKDDGSTEALIRERTNSYGDKKKILWVSTPRRLEGGIINKLYDKGDQRKYHIPCPCCGTMITLEWEVYIDEFKAGFTWQTDKGVLVPGSVEYICQSCREPFTEQDKYNWNLAGQWIPTATPKQRGLISFYLPAWYQAPGMDGWELIVQEYISANPEGQQPDRKLMHTFRNLRMGLPSVDEEEELTATKIQENQQDYDIGIVPERLSAEHGNGKIVLIVCTADCGGLLDDGRLDYLVTAYAENGATYALLHGSIGTFVPAVLRRKSDILRDETKWTYEENKPNCIWDEFEKIITREFKVDVSGKTPRNMSIALTLVDTGNTYKNHVYVFVDKMLNKGLTVQGIKGRANTEYYAEDKDATVIHRGKEQVGRLWTIEVGYVKDRLASNMGLNHKPADESQPSGFMNFPRSAGGLFQRSGFFEHYESEKRVVVSSKDGGKAMMNWKVKASNAQNHFWDCAVYTLAAKDIWLFILSDRYKPEKIDWQRYVDWTTSLKHYQ